MRGDGGFTLLEFVVAVLILMIGLLGLLQTIGLSHEHNLGNQRREDAFQVADNLMLVEKGKPFGAISMTTSSWKLHKSPFKTGFVDYSVTRAAKLVATDTIDL